MNEIPNYDAWKLQCGLEDEKVFCSCEHCDGEIYVGDFAIQTVEGWVHEDCFDGYAREALDAVTRVAEDL